MENNSQTTNEKGTSRRLVLRALATGGALTLVPSLTAGAEEEPRVEFQDCRHVRMINLPEDATLTWVYVAGMWYPPNDAQKVPWQSKRIHGAGVSTTTYSVRPFETIVAAEIEYGGMERSYIPFINPNGCAKQLIEKFNVRIEDGRITYDNLHEDDNYIPVEPPNTGNAPDPWN